MKAATSDRLTVDITTSGNAAWTRAAPGSSRTNARSAEASRIALLTRGFRAPLRDQLLRPQGLVVLGIAPDRILHAADRTVDTEDAQLSIHQMQPHLVADRDAARPTVLAIGSATCRAIVCT